MATSKIQTGLRIAEPLYDKLRVLATQENRSLNNLIEYVLHDYVARYEKRQGEIILPVDQDFSAE